jgi:hypothetical protein
LPNLNYRACSSSGALYFPIFAEPELPNLFHLGRLYSVLFAEPELPSLFKLGRLYKVPYFAGPELPSLFKFGYTVLFLQNLHYRACSG